MIISLSGRKQSGKNTVANMLQFLLPLDDIVNANYEDFLDYIEKEDIDYILDVELNQFGPSNKYECISFASNLKHICAILADCNPYNFESEDFKNALTSYTVNGVALTGRQLLTHIGDKLREDNSNIWLELLRLSDNCIVTDTRFPNELSHLRDKGAITVRISRPCSICGMTEGQHKMSCQGSYKTEHYSEYALDKVGYDYYIKNTGSIEELFDKVKKLCQTLRKNIAI